MSGPHWFHRTGGNISQLYKLHEEEEEEEVVVVVVVVVEAEKVHLFSNINRVFI